MTTKEIYEQVVQLTSELHSVGAAEKIFSAAQTGDETKVKAAFETFKKDNSELHQRIVRFGEEFNKTVEGESDYRIFGEEEKNITVYDANTVDALSLYALSFFANIDEACLFEWGTEASEIFLEAIKDSGYKKLSEFVETSSWKEQIVERENYTLYELLIDLCIEW